MVVLEGLVVPAGLVVAPEGQVVWWDLQGVVAVLVVLHLQ